MQISITILCVVAMILIALAFMKFIAMNNQRLSALVYRFKPKHRRMVRLAINVVLVAKLVVLMGIFNYAIFTVIWGSALFV